MLDIFLTKQGLSKPTITFLAGDASPRKYYRIKQDTNTYVLMETPASEKPGQFINIARILTQNGFSAPQILGHDVNAGYILLEDLTDATFTKVLATTPDSAMTLYSLAVDTLIALAQTFHSKPACVEHYSQDQFMEGVLLFADWYYPASHGHDLPITARNEFEKLWLKIFDKVDELPKTLILRDFHVDNLIHLPDRQGTKACGLIDFQDARWGPMSYDFVSLIDDVRIDIPQDIEDHCWDFYSQSFPRFRQDMPERALAYMTSVSRLVRILGTFTRLAQRDGKHHYLNHIPRIWRLVDKNLKHPELAEIKYWFDAYVTQRDIQYD